MLHIAVNAFGLHALDLRAAEGSAQEGALAVILEVPARERRAMDIHAGRVPAIDAIRASRYCTSDSNEYKALFLRV